MKTCCLIFRLTFALLILAGMTAGAAEKLPAKSATGKAAAGTNAPTFSTNSLDAAHLNPMDKIRFRIKEDPIRTEQPIVLSVSALSDVDFPISAGSGTSINIKVGDKTLSQVRDELKTKLEADYYQKATVEMNLEDRSQRAGQVLLFGSVGVNRIALPPGEKITILEIILQAHPGEYANLKKVKLMRVDPVTKTNTTTIIDVEKIKKGNLSGDIPILDGDRIDIPEKSIIF